MNVFFVLINSTFAYIVRLLLWQYGYGFDSYLKLYHGTCYQLARARDQSIFMTQSA